MATHSTALKQGATAYITGQLDGGSLRLKDGSTVLGTTDLAATAFGSPDGTGAAALAAVDAITCEAGGTADTCELLDAEGAVQITLTVSGPQIVEITADATPATDGTFTLTVAGQTTSALAHDASADTIEAALEALSTVGEGNVYVQDGDDGDLGDSGGSALITFARAVPMAVVSITTAGLTGNAHTLATVSAGDGEMRLDNPTVVAGQQVAVSGFTYQALSQ